MERPIIMLNTDNMPVFCRNQCANTKCAKHITKAYECGGACSMQLLRGGSRSAQGTYHGGKGNDARKRMQVLRILRKLRKAGKIHEVYGLQRAAAGSRRTES